MLHVVTLEEAARRIHDRFGTLATGTEPVALSEALGRRIAADVVAEQGVPAFDRTTVDGFAVRASDTFGCSESLPALLTLVGEVLMGASPTCGCLPGTCVRIPTGGELPGGADAVVMARFSSSSVAEGTIEMLCYGTAVKFM